MLFLYLVGSIICYSNFLNHKEQKKVKLAYGWLGLSIIQVVLALLTMDGMLF